jgi:hypothetical protein
VGDRSGRRKIYLTGSRPGPGQLAARIGPRLQLTAGPLVVGAGLALLTLAPSGPGYARHVLPAVIVFGLGWPSPSPRSPPPR